MAAPAVAVYLVAGRRRRLGRDSSSLATEVEWHRMAEGSRAIDERTLIRPVNISDRRRRRRRQGLLLLSPGAFDRWTRGRSSCRAKTQLKRRRNPTSSAASDVEPGTEVDILAAETRLVRRTVLTGATTTDAPRCLVVMEGLVDMAIVAKRL